MTTLKTVLIVLATLFISPAWADDTDIYLENDAGLANPPYLMLMIDYGPQTSSSYCGDLRDCASKMTEDGFAELCNLFANKDTTDPVQNIESACRYYYQQVILTGITTQIIP